MPMLGLPVYGVQHTDSSPFESIGRGRLYSPFNSLILIAFENERFINLSDAMKEAATPLREYNRDRAEMATLNALTSILGSKEEAKRLLNVPLLKVFSESQADSDKKMARFGRAASPIGLRLSGVKLNISRDGISLETYDRDWISPEWLERFEVRQIPVSDKVKRECFWRLKIWLTDSLPSKELP